MHLFVLATEIVVETLLSAAGTGGSLYWRRHAVGRGSHQVAELRGTFASFQVWLSHAEESTGSLPSDSGRHQV